MPFRAQAPYLNFKLSEIYRWGFKPNTNFYFEVKKSMPVRAASRRPAPGLTACPAVGGSGPVYEFETAEGNVISDLLTDYAMVRACAAWARGLVGSLLAVATIAAACAFSRRLASASR